MVETSWNGRYNRSSDEDQEAKWGEGLSWFRSRDYRQAAMA